MRPGQYQNFVGERVTVLTDGERIEGRLFHMGGTRLSDFLNSSSQQEYKFLKIKDPTIHCRRTGQELTTVPFLMVARDRIVMLLCYSSADDDQADADDPFADYSRREHAGRPL